MFQVILCNLAKHMIFLFPWVFMWYECMTLIFKVFLYLSFGGFSNSRLFPFLSSLVNLWRLLFVLLLFSSFPTPEGSGLNRPLEPLDGDTRVVFWGYCKNRGRVFCFLHSRQPDFPGGNCGSFNLFISNCQIRKNWDNSQNLTYRDDKWT